jgi:8-oxo-dGTP pyrophosphatase MutT (NUDIX family)
MPRIPLQVLVLPFQVGESAEQAARREAMEEAGIPADAPLIRWTQWRVFLRRPLRSTWRALWQ